MPTSTLYQRCADVWALARSTYYYECKGSPDETALKESIQTAFDENRRIYGQRKLKHVLARSAKVVSCRKIGRIIRKRGLVSVYTRKKYRLHHDRCNEAPIPNLLQRKFNEQKPNACVVSDLTYVRVSAAWPYVCILLDLHSRKIISFSAGRHKDGALVRSAFASIRGSLFDIQVFLTDRGSEFDNRLINDILDTSRSGGL